MVEENKTLIPVWIKLFLIIVLLLCLFILYQYGKAVGGGYSENPQDWGAFGSLLSGTFGLLASFAAVATLLIVIEQFGRQSTLTTRQLEAFEFDRYDKHRRIFFEKLEAIEKRYKETIVFENKEDLYQKIFIGNSPKRCEMSINEHHSSKTYNTKHFIDNLEDLADICDNLNRDPIKLSSTDLQRLTEIGNALHLKSNIEKKTGEILNFGNRTIFNAYKIEDDIKKTMYAYKTIAGYGGVNISKYTEPFVAYYAMLNATLKALHPEKGFTLLSVHQEKPRLYRTYERLLMLIDKSDDREVIENCGNLQECLIEVFFYTNKDEQNHYLTQKVGETLKELEKLLENEHLADTTKTELVKELEMIKQHKQEEFESKLAWTRLQELKKNNPPL